MPDADVEITHALVRRLVDEQAVGVITGVTDLPLTLLAQGWDNVVYRLGEAFTVRLPRRALSASLIETEARWVPVVAPYLPVVAPIPLVRGRPTADYPYPWLVCRWVPGADVGDVPIDERRLLATDLADTLCAFHAHVAPHDGPVSPWRGVPLARRADAVRRRIAAWSGEPGAREVLLDAWDAGVAAPPYPGPSRWLHGDPHPFNLLQVGGRLSGVIDLGDLTGGDPANDPATAWWTFGPDDRASFRDRVDELADHDPWVWTRARAWAASFASAMEPGSPLDAIAHHTARQLRLDD